MFVLGYGAVVGIDGGTRFSASPAKCIRFCFGCLVISPLSPGRVRFGGHETRFVSWLKQNKGLVSSPSQYLPGRVASNCGM